VTGEFVNRDHILAAHVFLGQGHGFVAFAFAAALCGRQDGILPPHIFAVDEAFHCPIG